MIWLFAGVNSWHIMQVQPKWWMDTSQQKFVVRWNMIQYELWCFIGLNIIKWCSILEKMKPRGMKFIVVYKYISLSAVREPFLYFQCIFRSVSFVLALASMAYLLLTVLYLVIDVFKLWGGTPFLFPGTRLVLQGRQYSLLQYFTSAPCTISYWLLIVKISLRLHNDMLKYPFHIYII